MKFKFIDLFAGIGGFHLAMHKLGGECVFASEIDKSARMTYEANFMKLAPNLFENGMYNDDIRKISPHDLPDFDVLCAGFPCQPFSQAGHKRGFDDNHNSERGNLFFNIAEIIEVKRPRAFFLENVRGLVSHDNGNTIKTIRDILENELGYSFYIKIVKASDYGLPQLRPRAYIVGFRDELIMKGFNYPQPTPLKFTMSDVWEGNCSREIGFTLRVGGRGSNINDRRNWDSYLVDGEVKRISPIEALKMQGFPFDFELPVGNVQAMKQLGNSVAVDAIEAVGANVINHMNNLTEINYNMKETKNKGEWSELFVFLHLLANRKLSLSDKNLKATNDSFLINKVSTLNLDNEYILTGNNTIVIRDKVSKIELDTIDASTVLTPEVLDSLKFEIQNGKNAFSIDQFNIIQTALSLSVIKGGNSSQKADIVLGVEHSTFEKADEGFGIKSYFGSKPTLFNASGTTNFKYKISGLQKEDIDEINDIQTRTKIVDRIKKIAELGGCFNYVGAENSTLDFNLKLVDGDMPDIVGKMLMLFYQDRITKIQDVVELMSAGNAEYKLLLQVKVKKLLVDILLGLFPGSKWNGAFTSNGTIVLKNDGECVAFHIIELETLKNYLFENIKFDTPSSTRHRFGKIYIEKDGNMYFKLNMQLRF